MITIMMLQTTNRLIKSSHNAENQLFTLFCLENLKMLGNMTAAREMLVK